MINIMIPYRGMPDCLTITPKKLENFLKLKYHDRYKIIIVEQEEGKLFNLAKLINVGFDILLSKGMQYHDTFVFWPIDCIPVNINFDILSGCKLYCDSQYHQYYAKAFGWLANDFARHNGVSNEFWNWGAEDQELFTRLEICQIPYIRETCQLEILTNESPSSKSPTLGSDYDKNIEVLHKFKQERNVFYSGLNTLEYEIKEIGQVCGIEKFVVSI